MKENMKESKNESKYINGYQQKNQLQKKTIMRQIIKDKNELLNKRKKQI